MWQSLRGRSLYKKKSKSTSNIFPKELSNGDTGPQTFEVKLIQTLYIWSGNVSAEQKVGNNKKCFGRKIKTQRPPEVCHSYLELPAYKKKNTHPTNFRTFSHILSIIIKYTTLDIGIQIV